MRIDEKKLRKMINEEIQAYLPFDPGPQSKEGEVLDFFKSEFPWAIDLSLSDVEIVPNDYTRADDWIIIVPEKRVGYEIDLEHSSITPMRWSEAEAAVYGDKDDRLY